MVKFIFTLLLLHGCASFAHAQTKLPAHASATIVEPVGVSKIENLDFGEFASPNSDATVTLTTSNYRIVGKGMTESKIPWTAAVIDIYTSNYSYSISAEQTLNVTNKDGGKTMEIKDIVWEERPLENGDITHQLLFIGATLHVNKQQPTGIYTSATPFTIIINYN